MRSADDHWCCLGVLCDVLRAEWTKRAHHYQLGHQPDPEAGGYAFPHHEFLEAHGIESIESHLWDLAYMNDGIDGQPRSFKQIANYIEANL